MPSGKRLRPVPKLSLFYGKLGADCRWEVSEEGSYEGLTPDVNMIYRYIVFSDG